MKINILASSLTKMTCSLTFINQEGTPRDMFEIMVPYALNIVPARELFIATGADGTTWDPAQFCSFMNCSPHLLGSKPYTLIVWAHLTQ